jgi:hypothetical protein
MSGSIHSHRGIRRKNHKSAAACNTADTPKTWRNAGTLQARGCTIKWIARDAEIGVIKHWSHCTASLSEQLSLWEQICATFFNKDKNTQVFRTLFWGRLEPEAQNGSRELSLRLALAASQSPGRDVKQGKPKSGDMNGFVRDIAQEDDLSGIEGAVWTLSKKHCIFLRRKGPGY